MSTFTKSMFASIKDALTKEGSNNKTADIIRTKPGNSYEIRLLPNIEDPSKTFHHYYSHGWTSYSTGQYVTAVSPTTWGDRDPIAEYRLKVFRGGAPEEKAKSDSIYRRENWLVNAYVISDPDEPDNNDTVKILRFGKQLHKIIMEGINGEDSDQFGEKIFDLSDLNFKKTTKRNITSSKNPNFATKLFVCENCYCFFNCFPLFGICVSVSSEILFKSISLFIEIIPISKNTISVYFNHFTS